MSFFIFIAAFAGAMLPLQGSINARLGRALGSAFWAAGVSAALTGILLGVASLAITRSLPKVDGLSSLPSWAWLGGICGFFIMAGITLAAPRLGAAGMVAFVGRSGDFLHGHRPLWPARNDRAADQLPTPSCRRPFSLRRGSDHKMISAVCSG